MSGRPSEESMMKRRLKREPVLRNALAEKVRLESEIARLDAFLSVSDEMNKRPGQVPGHA